MKIVWSNLLFAFLLVTFFGLAASAQNNVTNGTIKIDAGKLQPGANVDLTGNWFYEPGYLTNANQKPETINPKTNDLTVGVPQFLNRVRWWLDDSEDFRKHEDARLKKLGFETEKASDGWYKLILDAAQMPRDKRIFVEFEGVAMKSKVFLNGAEIGNHTGMFSRFGFDLTPHLKAGINLLAVYVSMENIPVSTASLGQAVSVNLTASKVLSLSKGMFGPLEPVNDNRAYDLHGIWQPVRLVVRGAAGKLDDVYFVPSLNGATVKVEASGIDSTQNAILKARWIDPKTGKTFAETAPAKVQLRNEKLTTTLELKNVQPRLWTPAEPNLYLLEVTLESANGEILDRFAQNVGFRTFEARGNQFYLNGKLYWLRGVNHLPYGKNPWDTRLARRLIQLMHDNNERVTRTHATPWNEAWLDAADEIGLGVSIEGIRPWAFVGKIGPTPADLFEHWLMENEDVVKRIRNHPSVLLWTVGNEMLLRDHENPEKWKQLSDVVKQTRALDATRPVVVSSSYVREAELYHKVIKPNNIDDGDVDDIHSYRGWYADSPFVTNSLFEKELKDAKLWNRPFIGQEMSTGYPDLDTGLPVLRYTRNQITPQAWIGVRAYPGNDPTFFLEHQRAVTKRWAEQLRFQRANKTAGFMLFANECWFARSYDSQAVKPYPVVEAVKYAFAPIGLALETAQRRFYAGGTINTAVFVTNDDEQFRTLKNLSLEFLFVNENQKQIAVEKSGNLGALNYYETAKIPVEVRIPPTGKARTKLNLITRLLRNNQEIGRTVDPIEVFPVTNTPKKLQIAATQISLGPAMSKFVEEKFQNISADYSNKSVVFVGKNAPLDELKQNGKLYQAAIDGATIIVFSPGQKIQEFFPNDVLSFKKVSGEFADWTPAAGTKLAQNLEPMDLKWWARANDWRVMIASDAHRLNPNGQARELIRFIPAHGYIAAERIPEQFMSVLFEISIGTGRLWICDLDLEQSIAIDPAARIFAENLMEAASDPSSTKNLIKMPSHEELLAGKKVEAK